ncbi:DUF3000 domain-containing protein [Demequina sp. NBRC 110057]|uniref:DUF3000 domain-containing protein n=1 Tax=Demequina sp. NBRC 110057 TaxID=1570346 RepID=UPI000A00F36B|nr:DUF3000 domain-containing protein [Demequina sp. NBRC 110057]
MAQDFAQAPPDFRAALTSLASARTRSDVVLAEAPAPGRLAPYAVAISGELHGDDAHASGRFVLLHDPDGHDAWDGRYRVVALVKAQVEPEVGADEMWADVAWSWLEESLDGVPHRARGGTVTKVTNSSYGELAERPDEVHVELRVSWTPLDNDMEPHVQAWTDLLATCAGVPPLPEGVTMLPGRHA